MKVRCIDATNPVPDTSGWFLTQGKEYDVVDGSAHLDWFIILADDGKPGSYHRTRFEIVEPVL